MKLHLSSFRLGDKTAEFKSLFSENKKVALVMNAIDLNDENERTEKMQREVVDLRSIGLLPEEVDLRRYFGKESELRSKFTEFGGVWVRGGNTFVLRRAFKYSGFDTILLEKNKEKNFVYSGYSAGICILSPTLKGIDLCDEPTLVPSNYNKDTIWEGLGIIDYSLAPHYKSDHPETELIEKSVEYFIAHNMPYKTLKDGEVIITTT